MNRRLVVSAFMIGVLGSVHFSWDRVGAEERVDQSVYWKIRQEATANSQVLKTAQMLTDVYGPRPTGSPNLKAAGEWAIKQMESWGLQNGRMEPWEWGYPGWLNERLSAHIVSPVKDHLVAEALGWTPGTNGPVKAAAVQMTLPARATKKELTAHLDGLKSVVKGKIVLVGAHQRVLVTFNDVPERREDRDILTTLNTPVPPAPAPPPANTPPAAPAADKPDADQPLTANQINEQVYEFLKSNGALVRVNDAARDHGQIRAFANATYDPSKAIPTVVLRNEDYGRVSRLLASGQTVELEFDIVNRIYAEGKTAYNAVAEIPGTSDEVVMLGGHLDSWHAATGATDNATGCSVVMEAVRILKAIGVKPKRTIRIALWSGEEQGLRGSRAYVSQHFGSFEEPKSDYGKFAGYVNIDYGTGRARYLTVFGPTAAGTILSESVASFKDLGVLGANTTRSRQASSTDSSSFNAAGLPGINVLQDPIEYDSYTWHSNLDTYERIIEEDVIKSSIVVAAVVYQLAMRDEQLPRFSKDEMPRRPGERDRRPVRFMAFRNSTARPRRSRSGADPVGQLLAIIDQAYDRPSWHGTNLRGSVRRLSALQAAWRPAPKRHNIWEIVVHAAYWKYTVTRRFTGEPRGSFALKGSNWFVRPVGDVAAEEAWREDLNLLDRMHASLRTSVRRLSVQDLASIPSGTKVSNFAVLSGIAAHDIYHAGQIQLLKRLSAEFR